MKKNRGNGREQKVRRGMKKNEGGVKKKEKKQRDSEKERKK